MTGTWQPINQQHSIELMGVTVVFAQPLPDLAFTKMLSAGEVEAKALGIDQRQMLSGFEIAIGVNGTPTPSAVQNGSSYNRFEQLAGFPFPGKLVEQIQFERNSSVYRTWQYTSWNEHSARIHKLMSAPLALFGTVVAPSALRMDYVDRFILDGDPSEAVTANLLNEASEMISPHIFGRPGLWHSHTGAFIADGDKSMRLLQIAIDASDVIVQGGEQPRRSVSITIGLEDRFKMPFASEIGSADISSALDDMHTQQKSFLDKILTESASKRISLHA